MNACLVQVREALESLHQWRITRGWTGPDEYHPDLSMLHPMTVGAWGRAYAVLSAVECAPAWSAGMHESCECLLREANRTGRFRHACWGLPFAWHGNPPHFPYLITTVLAGSALLEGSKRTGNDEYLQAAASAGRWIVDENGWTAGEDGSLCFNYAPCDALRVPIHNVNAMAAGFLAELSHVTGDDTLGYAADQAVAYLLESQAADGSWRYQEDRPADRPESHTGYILEGLALYVLERPRRSEPVLCALRRGLEFYRTQQFDGPRALHSHAGISMQEGRLWSQGWGIAAFALGHRVIGDAVWMDQACATAAWALDRLRKPNGAFRFRTDDGREFPRHIAHMAYGLAYLLRETIEQ